MGTQQVFVSLNLKNGNSWIKDLIAERLYIDIKQLKYLDVHVYVYVLYTCM